MSNADLLEDLKQFIDSRFSQFETHFEGRLQQTEVKFEERLQQTEVRLESKLQATETRFGALLEKKIDVLRSEMHDGFAGIADAMEENNKYVDQRLNKLEQQAA